GRRGGALGRRGGALGRRGGRRRGGRRGRGAALGRQRRARLLVHLDRRLAGALVGLEGEDDGEDHDEGARRDHRAGGPRLLAGLDAVLLEDHEVALVLGAPRREVLVVRHV